VQVLGNTGYSGERVESAENRLENGDINLREFIRQVACSNPFRRRYWEGLYITKAIEVIHRRLLGRPTFGRWEIDALFDTAARKGFYGVVDALVSSKEFSDCFGDDTVPYERFITPNDLTVRRAPGLIRDVKVARLTDTTLRQRPDPIRNDKFLGTGDVTTRNLKPTGTSPGMWTANVSNTTPSAQWTNLMRSRGAQSASGSPTASPFATPISRTIGSSTPNTSDARLRAALVTVEADGYRFRGGLPIPAMLRRPADESELRQVIDATYQQLLNRVPLENQRMVIPESKLRDGQMDLDEFVEAVALGEDFQERLYCMAPLRAATAASLALLGRASTPSETSRFLRIRFESGQPAAVSDFLAQRNASTQPSSVPGLDGMNTQQGVPQETITRTASLYRGPAGMTPPPQEAL